MSHTPTLSHEAMLERFKQDLKAGVGKKIPHESAERHVTGEAIYALMSPHAHAEITHMDLSSCYQPGVACVLTAKDVPGQLDIGPVFPGDPLLADGKVEFLGQPVIAVAATSLEIARTAAKAALIEYKPLDAIIDVEEALAKKHFVQESHEHRIGDAKAALSDATHTLSGELHIGGQEHFYLESQVASVMPTEDGGMIVYSSTQNPTEVQKLVAEVIGVPMNKVVVDMRRMGGGFGVKKHNLRHSPAYVP